MKELHNFCFFDRLGYAKLESNFEERAFIHLFEQLLSYIFLRRFLRKSPIITKIKSVLALPQTYHFTLLNIAALLRFKLQFYKIKISLALPM
jgi:hypothetical protein